VHQVGNEYIVNSGFTVRKTSSHLDSVVMAGLCWNTVKEL